MERTNTSDVAEEQRLAQLGVKQELKRGWGLLSNVGISFSIISVITGVTTLFEYGLTTGGPAVMSLGWIFVSFFTMFVATGMAEIVSAIPSAGGPYAWAACLAPPEHSRFASYMTGIVNFLGQIAVTCGISYGLAGLISTAASIDGYEPTPGKTLAIYIGTLVSHGLVNSLAVKTLKYLNHLSIALHSLGVFSLCVAVLAKAPTHRTAREVFATFYDGTGVDGAVGWSIRASPAYVCVIGILLAQYTITGFDASAHLSEETTNASRSAPIGVLTSVAMSAVFGFFLLCSLLFSIQDFDRTVNSSIGQPVFQILIDVFGTRGAKVLIALICLCVWHAGLFSITSNSRMMYSFARDGGLPKFVSRVNAKNGVPINAVWFAAFLAFLLALPSLGSSVAFSAATSVATVGLYLSYGFPILLGAIYHERFKALKGPFDLGRLSRPVASIASLYVVFIVVVLVLPELNPVTKETLNYTVIALGIVVGAALICWAAFARKSYIGPLAQIIEEGILGKDAQLVDEIKEKDPRATVAVASV